MSGKIWKCMLVVFLIFPSNRVLLFYIRKAQQNELFVELFIYGSATLNALPPGFLITPVI